MFVGSNYGNSGNKMSNDIKHTFLYTINAVRKLEL